MTAGSPWFPFGVGSGSGPRLVCIPHAGAGASTYRGWGAGLPDPVSAFPVQLPGRESRLWEKPFRHVGPLVGELAVELLERVPEPYAVFGHSMGALVAFELVREIRRLGGPAPVHLFVAGRHAPHLRPARRELRDLDLDELAVVLRRLGGTPPALLADPELLDSIAPLLRADFSVNETYDYVDEPPLDVPVTAFAATGDPRAEYGEVRAWEAVTAAEFAYHLLPGGHFAVLRHAAFVHARIAQDLAPWTTALRESA